MKAFIGNDLIDLCAAHNRGRAHSARLLDRTLTRGERDRMARERAGDLGFALLWSAKEAAYKAARKHDPSLVFAPRRWEVEVDSLAALRDGPMAVVDLGSDTRVTVRWQQGDGWLHCVALIGERPGFVDDAVATPNALGSAGDFSERERQGFSCPESAAVRVLAKRLLAGRGIAAIEIVRTAGSRERTPPQVCAGGTPLSDVDVSLSHDGRFVAAAIAVR